MNPEEKKQQTQERSERDGVERDGAGARFVPSEEPAKLEPTPEKAREQKESR